MSPYQLMSSKLGPAFVPPPPRPVHYVSPSYPFPGGPDRVNPYNLGTPNSDTGDYWSDSGQVAYIPDETISNDPGLGATKRPVTGATFYDRT